MCMYACSLCFGRQREAKAMVSRQREAKAKVLATASWCSPCAHRERDFKPLDQIANIQRLYNTQVQVGRVLSAMDRSDLQLKSCGDVATARSAGTRVEQRTCGNMCWNRILTHTVGLMK